MLRFRYDITDLVNIVDSVCADEHSHELNLVGGRELASPIDNVLKTRLRYETHTSIIAQHGWHAVDRDAAGHKRGKVKY